MKKAILPLVLALATLLIGATASDAHPWRCYKARRPVVVVRPAPIVIRPAAVIVTPRPTFGPRIWIRGHWIWAGRFAGYVWIAGHRE